MAVSGAPGSRHFAQMICDQEWKLIETAGGSGERYIKDRESLHYFNEDRDIFRES